MCHPLYDCIQMASLSYSEPDQLNVQGMSHFVYLLLTIMYVEVLGYLLHSFLLFRMRYELLLSDAKR